MRSPSEIQRELEAELAKARADLAAERERSAALASKVETEGEYRKRYEGERARCDALVAALSKCMRYGCEQTATQNDANEVWCDGDAPPWCSELPYAAPLRAIIAARKEGT